MAVTVHLRVGSIALLGVLVVWGVTLGAWIATVATVGLIAVIARPPERARGIALALVGFIVTIGAIDTLVAVDRIGARAREGELGLRDKLAVYGFNVAFAAAAVPAGFADFGAETLALGVPWSDAGRCPIDRLDVYGDALRLNAGPPRLRRWSSEMPLRSASIRGKLAEWAAELPAPEPGTTRSFGPWRIPPWPTARYIAADEANRVPVALNTPLTRLSARAVVVDGGWRLDGVVDLPVAYPEISTLQIGPFALEEGMFYDAQPLLVPYCLEYRFAIRADDPRLDDPDPVRGPFESASTAVLRAIGAHYR